MEALFFTCLQYTSFENTMGKGEITRNEQFVHFAQCFLHVLCSLILMYDVRRMCSLILIYDVHRAHWFAHAPKKVNVSKQADSYAGYLKCVLYLQSLSFFVG